ncbi:transmembrane protein, putative [Medicago truncatula]|uniref:Transmembrane protein, putative n=1 Tax=Medicago truncatula TaxID=3880 RepID=A0A072UU90_MEDTR|nr:transmembrane protein, putative [Medicago truncatula]
MDRSVASRSSVWWYCQTYRLLEREKSSTTKDMMKSVPVALLIFLKANNNLSVSFSDGTWQPSQLLAESVALGSLGIRIQFGRIYGFGPIQRWGVWPPSHGFRESFGYKNFRFASFLPRHAKLSGTSCNGPSFSVRLNTASDIVEAKEYLKQRGVDPQAPATSFFCTESGQCIVVVCVDGETSAGGIKIRNNIRTDYNRTPTQVDDEPKSSTSFHHAKLPFLHLQLGPHHSRSDGVKHNGKGFVRSSKLLLLFSVAVPEKLTGGTKEYDGLLVVLPVSTVFLTVHITIAAALASRPDVGSSMKMIEGGAFELDPTDLPTDIFLSAGQLDQVHKNLFDSDMQHNDERHGVSRGLF